MSLPPKLRQEPMPVSADTVSPLRLVVYADPKVGKTTLGLSFPRPLIVNTDFGLEGDALQALHEVGGSEVRPEGFKDLEGLYFYIRDHSEDFDTILIDSGDELIRMLLDEVVKEGAGGRSGSNSGALGQTFFDVVPEQAEYLANQHQMNRILTDLRRLGKHMVITFGVREGAGTQGRASYNTSPGLQKPVMHFASVIARLLVAPADFAGDAEGAPYKKGDRLLLTDAGSTTSMVGTRYASLSPYVVNPTFDKLWGAMYPASNQTSNEGN